MTYVISTEPSKDKGFSPFDNWIPHIHYDTLAAMKVNAITEYLSMIGAKGGAAGKGKAKRRGNSEYYRKLRAKRTKKALDNASG